MSLIKNHIMKKKNSKFTLDLGSLSKDKLKGKLESIEESFLKQLGQEIENPDAISGGNSSPFSQTHISGGWLRS